MSWLDARRTHTPIGPMDDDAVTRVLVTCALFMAAMFVVLTPAWMLDPRLVEGVNAWTKPQKFHLSLLVHFVTLAVLAQTLPRTVRAGPTLSIVSYLALGAVVMESVYIAIQAARARRSHFNLDTSLEAIMYAVMGLGALLLIATAIALGVQIWRKGQSGAGLRIGAATGLIVGGVLTVVLAGYMSNIHSARWVGEHPIGGATVPLFGWSREVGDLRPAHFVTLHMMQTLPVIGWLTDRAGATTLTSALVISGAAAVQAALALFLFFQALAGQPMWPA